jgi:hypothetical protein
MNTPDHDGRRPAAGAPDRCLYCGKPHPEHTDECVCRCRTVVMELRIRYVTEVPRSWGEHDIEFSRNESSRCADNDLAQIAKELHLFDEERDGPWPCACRRSESHYLREATRNDHLEMGYLGSEEP